MELRNIKTFLCVAEQCSFSKAAVMLGYSQSTVTTQIQQLEQEFGTLLFERIHKTVRLTAAGTEFVGFAQKMLLTADEAKNAMKRLPEENGELRIAMAESLCSTFFPDILERYHKEYPNVDLSITTGGTDDIFYMLRHNEADMVYTLDRRIYSTDLVTALEKEENVYFVASPSYSAAGKAVTLEDLTKYDFILTEKNMSYRKHLDELMASKSLQIRPFLELGSVEMIRTLVERGIGISFLPYYAVKDSIKNGTLVKIDVSENQIEVWRQLIYHKNKWVSPAMRAMIKLIKEYEKD
ncbi:MAG: LysR family transcriptional regulator [Eubacteriales bacterium]|nr:LysR family transcriptional regulator [Eubacteriales bacterium]